MATVKVLVDAVGQWNKGDIVKDAPPGLVEMAEKGTINIATGERVAEIVEDDGADKEQLKQLKAHAKELKIDGYGKMSVDQLNEAISAAEKAIADAEEEAKKKLADEEQLKQLQAKAAELQIADFDKLSRDELITAVDAAEKAAIEAAGGGKVGE